MIKLQKTTDEYVVCQSCRSTARLRDVRIQSERGGIVSPHTTVVTLCSNCVKSLAEQFLAELVFKGGGE